ncbi:MAG TPA: CHASE3 domain-containing protein [Sphingomonas sp.]|jgi:signal transduction histidine kinase/CheY-like chemotaxis protein|uniref:CHASE3 domain-containing protein n=1 Tax=Sphingomonas sp. TaxID=28214 RepID=UPI002EDB300A
MGPLIIGFSLLALTVLGTLWMVDRQERSFAMVRHTLEVQNRLTTILSRLQDAETGQRGYLLTRRAEFLKPYDAALTEIGADFSALAYLVADNDRQVSRLKRLLLLADRRRALLRATLNQDRLAATGGAISLADERDGRRLMDAIRRLIREMGVEEQQLLIGREALSNRQAALVKIGLIATILTMFLLALFAIRAERARLRDAVAARLALETANARLVAEMADRTAAESQVRQMQKIDSIGQLTGGIAHDFNNMLGIIIGSLDLAIRRWDRDPIHARAFIDDAREGALRGAQLTARLLAFSRQQALEPAAVDVNRLVGGMSEMLRRTIGEQIAIEAVLAGGLWPAYIDAGQLENAVLNLCVNARDAMPDGGKLTIETNNTHLDEAYADAHAEVTPGQYVLLCVTDTGTGMTPAVIERAFDPFYTTKDIGKGTGLGLSQVFGFVKQSGGHIKIYSEPGQGTAVRLYLPRHFGETGTNDARAASDDALPQARTAETVLVVEDDARVRTMSVDALEALGYTVLQATDGAHALEMLEHRPRIDLLFTDIIMPGMTGRQLADLASARFPEVKILFTTGYTRNAVVHNGVLDPGVAFLSKPFSLHQLAVKVRQVLDGGGANR